MQPQKFEKKDKLPVPGENGAKFPYFALDFYFEQSLVPNSGARNRDFRVLRYKHTIFFQRFWHEKRQTAPFWPKSGISDLTRKTCSAPQITPGKFVFRSENDFAGARERPLFSTNLENFAYVYA